MQFFRQLYDCFFGGSELIKSNTEQGFNLTLNAAVEAVRVGKQGRSFAVIASEVLRLAMHSAEAARGIKQLVTQNIEQVRQGVLLVSSTGSIMKEVVGSFKLVSNIIGEISTATPDQNGE